MKVGKENKQQLTSTGELRIIAIQFKMKELINLNTIFTTTKLLIKRLNNQRFQNQNKLICSILLLIQSTL